ncbi:MULTISPECIES: hypothetical protein [unclassified Rathayibacter]|uniref:hypothetical protein n=1 Tax=unclassified Rathayibacter TaxID=2609250 RepID=UPI000CE7C6AB|nr:MULTISPECIES: hypothetical protein [unclassified Rathayibacter]PPH54420.1 hypothetical protein C5C67_06675 [Rathayibacter sp. AY1E1]
MKSAVSVLCAAALVLAGNLPAVAAPSGASLVAQHEAATTTSYTDHDIISFLVLGSGPVYEDHKALSPYAPEVDSVTVEARDEMYALFMGVEPNFNELVTVPLQSGDPRLVDVALENFSEISYGVAEVMGLNVPDKEEFVSARSIVFVVVVAAVAGAAVATVAGAGNVGWVWNTIDFWGTSTEQSPISHEKRAAQFAAALGK